MKMKASPLLLILLMILAANHSFGQSESFIFRQKIEGISGTWHKLVLENDVFANAKSDLGDLRILGISDKGDTLEVPYMLKILTGKTTKKEIPFTLINQTTGPGGYYYTFEVPGPEEVNHISLDFEEKNFDWRVNLDGSQQLNDWFNILEGYRILSIKTAATDYTFTDIKFLPAKFRYFRLSVQAGKKPGLLKATLMKEEAEPGRYRDYTVKSFEVSENKKTRQTMLDIRLSGYVPVSMLIPEVDKQFDFYRPVQVQCLIDSVKGPDGWNYSYQNVYRGMLSSLEDNQIIMGQSKGAVFKMIIDNQNNKPLQINSVAARGNLYELTCRFLEPAAYYLFYGNKNISTPDYDIGHFSDKIPADITTLTLGAPEPVPQREATASQPLFTNKIWLWGLMILIIALLGWFSMKMIKS